MIIDPIISKNVALIKDANGKDIERIYDKYGNLVFKNWKTLEGPFPIGCFTSSNKLRNYRIYGNTIQDGTPTPETPVEVQGCGEQTENLFNKDTAVVYYAYITGVGKWFYSTDSQSVRIRVKPNTQYTLSTEGTYKIFRILEVQSDDIPTEQNKYPEIPGILIMRGEDQSHCTFKTSENAKYIVFQSNQSVVNQWLNELMLVEGDSVRSDYIPYGYKIPVTVSGVNLFDAEHFMNSDNVVAEGNNMFLINLYTKYSFSFPVDIGETYTIALYVKNVYINPAALELAICHGEKKSYSKGNDNIIITLKSTDKLHYRTKTFIAKENWISIQGMSTHVKDIMLIKGSVIPDYEPYHEPITTPVYIGSEPLHKIGDYADYVDFKRGVVVRRIKKLVLTGEEAVSQDSVTNTVYVQLTTTSATLQVVCTHFMSTSTIPAIAYRFGYAFIRLDLQRLYFGTTLSIDDDFKTYLATQYAAGTPVTIWYVLATPEEEVLPLSQKIPTNIGSNTFSCTISPAPSKAMIQYKKK